MPILAGDLESATLEALAAILLALVASDDPVPSIVPEDDVVDDLPTPIIAVHYEGDRELGPHTTDRLARARLTVVTDGDGARRTAAELIARIRAALTYPAFSAAGLEAFVVGGSFEQESLDTDPDAERRLVLRRLSFTLQATVPA
jgi:hypothetical protein